MQGKMDLAVPMYERLIEIKEKEGGTRSGRVETSMAVVYTDLGECYSSLGRVDEANKMRSRSEKIMDVKKKELEEEKAAYQSDDDNEEEEEEEVDEAD